MKRIRCKKEMHLMCFYCATNQSFQIMKNNLESKKDMENFNESFNMSIYRFQ